MDKSDLCQCSISAGTWYIQENIVYCTDKVETKIDLYYTVNMAVIIYQFEDKINKQEVTDMWYPSFEILGELYKGVLHSKSY